MAGTLVPSFTFGTNGFTAPSSSAVLTGVQGDINASFGGNLNYTLTTPQGQLATSWAAIINNTYSTFQYFTQQVDPAYASGRMQDAIGRLIPGFSRNPSEPTQLQISCIGAASTPIPANALIQDTSGNLYQCVGGGTIPSGGSITLQFNCTLPGPVPVPAGNAVSIYQAIPGWDAVGVISGVQGVNVEGRAAFETRRQDSVAGNSQGPVGAIIGAVAQVSGVLDYWGYNNNSATPVTIFGVTVPANAIYIAVAGGTTATVGAAIFSKKGAGAPMAGNTTVTVYDNNPLYAQPIPYTVTYEIPTPIQLLVSVALSNNPGIPSNATTLVQNALIAAMTGQGTLTPAPPKVRIGTNVYAANYVATVAALGSWAQIKSLTVGSINTSPAVFDGNISGNTLTITNLISGSVAIGQAVFDQDNRILNGTYITAGSGSVWTVGISQSLGATFTGNTSGSSTSITVSAITGAIGLGDVITGAAIPANTTIVSQTSGTTGGNGVYVMSAAANLTNIACATNAVITAAAAASSSTVINANQVPQITAPNIAVTIS